MTQCPQKVVDAFVAAGVDPAEYWDILEHEILGSTRDSFDAIGDILIGDGMDRETALQLAAQVYSVLSEDNA